MAGWVEIISWLVRCLTPNSVGFPLSGSDENNSPLREVLKGFKGPFFAACFRYRSND